MIFLSQFNVLEIAVSSHANNTDMIATSFCTWHGNDADDQEMNDSEMEFLLNFNCEWEIVKWAPDSIGEGIISTDKYSCLITIALQYIV